jgi:alpha-L-fucosidase
MAVKQVSHVGLKRYQDDRFGMFIHWGLYSLIGASEWVMLHRRMENAEYEKLAGQFTAPKFDAERIARTAANAGQRWITITSRHHDGFSMYDTALSEYKVTRTPFARDPIAELATACARHGVRLGFYVSCLDWHHPAYREARRTRSGLVWDDYLAFLHGQIRELCTNYGEVAEFWLDGYWPVTWPYLRFQNWCVPGGDFHFAEIYELIHTLQPDAVIMNNHHSEPMPGEDVQGYEGDVPGENTNLGLNSTPASREALETCQTLTSAGYGFQRHDHQYRGMPELVDTLVRAAASGANLLLNVGPTPDGEITAPAVDRLSQLGKWLEVNGEGIYGTRAGTVTLSDESSDPPTINGVVSTRAANGPAHYIHILGESTATSMFVDLPPGEHASAATATLLRDGGTVPLDVVGDGDSLRLTVPAERRDGLATTIRLDIEPLA